MLSSPVQTFRHFSGKMKKMMEQIQMTTMMQNNIQRELQGGQRGYNHGHRYRWEVSDTMLLSKTTVGALEFKVFQFHRQIRCCAIAI